MPFLLAREVFAEELLDLLLFLPLQGLGKIAVAWFKWILFGLVLQFLVFKQIIVLHLKTLVVLS